MNRIEVFFLPPYRQELNPQEYVTQDVKTNVIGKNPPLKRAICETMLKILTKRKRR